MVNRLRLLGIADLVLRLRVALPTTLRAICAARRVRFRPKRIICSDPGYRFFQVGA